MLPGALEKTRAEDAPTLLFLRELIRIAELKERRRLRAYMY